jgi:hypothetical protein
MRGWQKPHVPLLQLTLLPVLLPTELRPHQPLVLVRVHPLTPAWIRINPQRHRFNLQRHQLNQPWHGTVVLHLVGNTRNHRMANPQKGVVISAQLSQSATAGTSPTSSQ